jgi:hypothetical protein
MYNDVKSCINYNNCKSDYFACDMAVRQGENLYPFLFALFISSRGRLLEKHFLLVSIFGSIFQKRSIELVDLRVIQP